MRQRERTIEALRSLAARPGTEHEGIVAREMLRRLEATRTPEDKLFDQFRAFLRTGLMEDLEAAVGKKFTLTCACGFHVRLGEKCLNLCGAHELIQQEIQNRFKRGDRVFYNRWAYPLNCPATVLRYVVPKPENGNYPWAWVTVKFDHLKSSRQIPVKSGKGWHLSHKRLSDEEAKRLAGV